MSDIQPADVIGMKQNIGSMRDAVRERRCVPEPIGCGRELSAQEIASWDYLTAKEYTQSGWCKTCQDKVFKDPEEAKACTHEGPCSEYWRVIERPLGECFRCTCDNPCCEVDVGVGIITCESQHCPVHGGE